MNAQDLPETEPIEGEEGALLYERIGDWCGLHRDINLGWIPINDLHKYLRYKYEKSASKRSIPTVNQINSQLVEMAKQNLLTYQTVCDNKGHIKIDKIKIK